LSEMR